MGRGQGLEQAAKAMRVSAPSRSIQGQSSSERADKEKTRYANVDSEIWQLAAEPGNEDELLIDGEVWQRVWDNPDGVRGLILVQTDEHEAVERVLDIREDAPFGTTRGTITPVTELQGDLYRLDYKYDTGAEKTTIMWEQAATDDGLQKGIERDDEDGSTITISQPSEEALRGLDVSSWHDLYSTGQMSLGELDERGYIVS